MTRRADMATSLLWLLAVVLIVGGLAAGAVKVASDFTASNVYRWTMAAMFLGGALTWFTLSQRDTLRRYFRR